MSNPASPILSTINTSNITGDVALASPEISPIRGSHNASSMLPDHPIHEGGRPQPTVNPGNPQKALVPLLEALKYGTKQMAMHKVSCAHFSLAAQGLLLYAHPLMHRVATKQLFRSPMSGIITSLWSRPSHRHVHASLLPPLVFCVHGAGATECGMEAHSVLRFLALREFAHVLL